MLIKRFASALLPALILATSGLLLQPGNTTYAAKPDRCTPWPACKDDGGGGGGEYFGSDGVDFITPSDVEPLKFDYHIIGTPARDTITAGSGADLIEGDDDRDEINALGGDDVIHGDGGSDIIDGGEGSDVVYGDAGGDWLRGGAGTGQDYLYGGADEDFLQFSPGFDRYDGGTEFDTIQFEDANSVTVDLAALSYTAKFNDPSTGLETTETWMFMNIEGVWGSLGNDVISGTLLNDSSLFGHEGDDVIHAGDGNDSIDGGPGDDEMHGGGGNDFLHGDGGKDVMYGDGGNDVISSRGDGADDVMYGGEGCDTFVFRRNFGVDTIIDFDIVDKCDRIDLTAYNPKFSLDLDDMSIVVVGGTDIVIDFWIRKQGGNGGTIILQNAESIGVFEIQTRIDFN